MSRRAASCVAGFCGLGLAGLLVDAVALAGAQSLEFDHVGTIPGPVQHVEVHGPRAYVASGRIFRLFDISDPSRPVEIGMYTFPRPIRGFQVVGSLAYVAADVFGLGILDVSGSDTPTLVGSVTTPGQARNVAVVGATAFVADVNTGVDIVSISNPAQPVLVGSVFLEGLASDVEALESLVYASDRPTGFYVIDPSLRGDTEPIGELQVNQVAPRSSFGSELRIAETPGGEAKTAVMVAGGPLQLVDIGNSAQPVELVWSRNSCGFPVVELE